MNGCVPLKHRPVSTRRKTCGSSQLLPVQGSGRWRESGAERLSHPLKAPRPGTGRIRIRAWIALPCTWALPTAPRCCEPILCLTSPVFQSHLKAAEGASSAQGFFWKTADTGEALKTKKKLCFWTVVLKKTLESPLDCKEIQPVHSKGDQSWVFIGRTDVEAETPILWPLDGKSWLIWQDPDAGKDWGQEEKGTIEDEMVGWHHRLNEHGFG